MEPVISVRELEKTYQSGAQSFRALDGINLDLHAGQVTMLVGPSGSGKTTLVSIMGCILRASAGSVKVLGDEITHLDETALPKVRLNHIGFVFQGFNLFPTLTARENVELTLDLKGIRGAMARRRAGDLLAQVGLSDKRASFPAELSGGQKQRVAIARALAGDPEIILADEPTAALDSTSGRAVMQMMQDLAHQRNRAVVVVTHDSRALEYADRVVKIEDGRILL
jgi:putative ABC transport system ATP-binding protein